MAQRKLSNDQVVQIRKQYAQGKHPNEIALEFGCSRNYVTMLARGNDRKNAGGPITRERMTFYVGLEQRGEQP